VESIHQSSNGGKGILFDMECFSRVSISKEFSLLAVVARLLIDVLAENSDVRGQL
jgi:hypothetical protein